MVRKKGQAFNYLIAGILALVLIVVLIWIMTTHLRDESDVTGDHIDSTTDDNDCDGIPNVIDKCCETSESSTNVDNWGCAIDIADARTPCGEGVERNCG